MTDRETAKRSRCPSLVDGGDGHVDQGDNQDPKFVEKIRKLAAEDADWPRQIMNDEGYFEVL